MSDQDPDGPFGNPDGARADLADVIHDFVDFGGDPAFGALSTRASDAKVRVIVGKLGAGKTVYLRRLQEYQGRHESVYADLPEQELTATEEVVRACQWFPQAVIQQKWMLLWNRAILRSLATHLIRGRGFRHWVTPELADDLSSNYRAILGDFLQPRSAYNELRSIINGAHNAHSLNSYLNLPMWDDLEYLLGEALRACPPIFFYLDGIDEEFSAAPMYWLPCQLGLFYQVMGLLRNPRLGGKLHVVITIRDVVMSSILRSEHAPKYIGEPHIRLLTWDRASLKVLLDEKLATLRASCFVGDPEEERSVSTWVGYREIDNVQRGVTETVVDYLLRHTRLIPRDVISIGNAICTEARKQRGLGEGRIPPDRFRAIVSQAARRFGDSQLAQCSNQIASDLMPEDAAQYDFTHVYVGPAAYVRTIDDELRSAIRVIGVDRFDGSRLEELKMFAKKAWDGCTDVTSVLWQNGLLGYVTQSGGATFYSLGGADEFRLPSGADDYVLHPCLIDSVGIRSVDGVPVGPA